MKIKYPKTFLEVVDWFGALFSLTGATILSSNIGFSGLAYVAFLISSSCYSYIGFKTKLGGLTFMNLAFNFLNIWGIWRHLIEPGL